MDFEIIAKTCGYISAGLYFFVDVPQIYINFATRSTEGFSALAIFIRCVGNSFNLALCYFEKRSLEIALPSIILLFVHLIQIFQFFITRKKKFYLLLYAIPIAATLLSFFLPSISIATRYFNSASQIMCSIPFYYTCISLRTTLGISLFSLHLYFIGSIFGLLMCMINCQTDSIVWMFYFIAIIYSVFGFGLAMIYDEYRIFDTATKHPKRDVIKLESM